jgi:hypothetical protein
MKLSKGRERRSLKIGLCLKSGNLKMKKEEFSKN